MKAVLNPSPAPRSVRRAIATSADGNNMKSPPNIETKTSTPAIPKISSLKPTPDLLGISSLPRRNICFFLFHDASFVVRRKWTKERAWEIVDAQPSEIVLRSEGKSLLFVCRQLYIEARPILASLATWDFLAGLREKSVPKAMREFYLPLTKTVTIRLPIRPKLEVGMFSALKELVFKRQPGRNDGSFDYFFPYSEDDKVNEGYLMEETDDVNAVHAAKESLLAVTWVRELVDQRKKELIIKDDFRCLHQDDTTTLDPTLPPWPDTSRESMVRCSSPPSSPSASPATPVPSSAASPAASPASSSASSFFYVCE